MEDGDIKIPMTGHPRPPHSSLCAWCVWKSQQPSSPPTQAGRHPAPHLGLSCLRSQFDLEPARRAGLQMFISAGTHLQPLTEAGVTGPHILYCTSDTQMIFFVYPQWYPQHRSAPPLSSFLQRIHSINAISLPLLLGGLNLLAPSVLILQLSGLNTLQGVQERHDALTLFVSAVYHGSKTGGGNIRVLIAVLVLDLGVGALPSDTLDRDESSRSSSGHNLIELLTLLEVDGAHLDVPAQIPRNLLYRVAGDALDDIFRVGHDKLRLVTLVLNGQEPGRRELVDVGPRLGVQVQSDAVTFLPRRFGVDQDGRVVTANLGGPRALRCRPVEVFEYETVDGVDAVVDAYGEYVDLYTRSAHVSPHRLPSPLYPPRKYTPPGD
jgi:hypothetical protein